MEVNFSRQPRCQPRSMTRISSQGLEGELLKPPSILLLLAFSFLLQSLEFLLCGLVGFHLLVPRFGGIVYPFQSFFSLGTWPFMAPSLVNPFWAPTFARLVSFEDLFTCTPLWGLLHLVFKALFLLSFFVGLWPQST